MANPQPIEDKATLYVLGELPADEQRQFEAELAASPELRKAVDELEEGVTALVASTPTRTPPTFVLTRIQEKIETDNQETKVISVFFGLLRNGWAAAAAVLAGWIIYAISMERPAPGPGVQTKVVQTKPMAEPTVSSAPTPTNLVAIPTAVRERETIILSNQLVGLQRQLTQLSQAVTQQQAMLNESNRIKFHQLVPVGVPENAAPNRNLSPALQRALFLAMARELGWLPSTNRIPGAPNAEPLLSPGETNQPNVDFVDLRPNPTANPPRIQSEAAAESNEPKALATSQAPAAAVIPAFASGETLMAAFDGSSLGPVGTQVTFTSEGGVFLGTAVLSENPLVVAIPISNFSAYGSPLTVHAVTPDGLSSTLQFQTATAP